MLEIFNHYHQLKKRSKKASCSAPDLNTFILLLPIYLSSHLNSHFTWTLKNYLKGNLNSAMIFL